ncbi:MAG: membrane protein insertion efficiency factor YidD [Fibrobacter sp.]|nr:membrane protein insertion efficiency factor YidD [Fibrobacter sp.]
MNRVLIALVRFYQVAHLPFYSNVCRFEPSCSNYAIEALKTHGNLKGFWLSIKRVSKCHPFHKGGFDPVPVKEKQL